MAHILIVEDDKLIRDGLIDMIKTNTDHEVSAAENGKQGFEQALATKPDLIISDVHMPEMEGTEMAAKLREDKWGKTVPIIIMTSDEMTSTINAALEVGVTSYLLKTTIDQTTLVQQIDQALAS